MRILLFATIVLLLSGCYSTRWYKANTSDQQYYQDNYACTQEAQQQTSSAYINQYGGSAQSNAGTNWPLYKQCMYARGYRETPTQAATKAEETKPFPAVAICVQAAQGEGGLSKEVAEATCYCMRENVPTVVAVTYSEFSASALKCEQEKAQNEPLFTQKYRAHLR